MRRLQDEPGDTELEETPAAAQKAEPPRTHADIRKEMCLEYMEARFNGKVSGIVVPPAQQDAHVVLKDVDFSSKTRLHAFCRCCRDLGGANVLYTSRQIAWRDSETLAVELSRDMQLSGLPFEAKLEKALEDKARAALRKLGSERFLEREEASAALRSIGWRAKPWVEEAARSRDAEVAIRCAELLESWKAVSVYQEMLIKELQELFRAQKP
ncbi:MAG TPA: hypothetical protein VEJ63_04365 [Planctomycetota bacterium]|nr:hypothetical protein [Planctomycetota bacterium]